MHAVSRTLVKVMFVTLDKIISAIPQTIHSLFLWWKHIFVISKALYSHGLSIISVSFQPIHSLFSQLQHYFCESSPNYSLFILMVNHICIVPKAVNLYSHGQTDMGCPHSCYSLFSWSKQISDVPKADIPYYHYQNISGLSSKLLFILMV